MLNSGIVPVDSDKRLRSSLTRAHKTSPGRVPATDKFDDAEGSSSSTPANDADNDGTLLTTTTTTTVEVKVKTTKTSSRKRKLNASNDITSDTMNKQQPAAKKRKTPRMTKLDEKPTTSQTVDQSALTDESAFGSCEPGTSVVLQGIVWNETDKGVLVVNITWRGKTYVGALLNTTEQNWAPPRYKSDVRSTKQNHNRDQQLTSIPSTHDSTERILRNGKRRGSSTTVTATAPGKTHAFKIPPTPPSSSSSSSKTDDALPTGGHDDDDTGSLTEDKRNDEIGDNDSSRSLSPTTSGTSTASSSPPLPTTPMAVNVPHSKALVTVEQKPNDSLLPYHFPREMVDPSSYFSSRAGPPGSFGLSPFNKLTAPPATLASASPFLPMSAQLYFNPLALPHYSSVSSLSKSSH